MSDGFTWNGDEVLQAVQKRMAAALGEFGLTAEGYAKMELTKGHGVITGTLRRSIHTAEPGYSFSSDDTEPGANAPEQGGKQTEAAMTDRGLVLLLGSGLRYALPVHQGHGSFDGYHFLTIGVDKAKTFLPRIIEKYKLRRKSG